MADLGHSRLPVPHRVLPPSRAVATLGVLPLGTVYPLLFLLGAVSGASVLVWPIGREVNPPHPGGIAVAIVNCGGFLGAALTQGPVGAVLDARWTGTLQDGARVCTTEAYRAVFGVCALLVLLAAAMSPLLRETPGRNISEEVEGAAVRS